jgi:hypothetical protein
MEFPKESIIDKSLKDFEKEHPVLSKWIRLKVKIKFLYYHYFDKA